MFARHYLRNLGWFLFLWVLRWFSSPGSLQVSYVFRYWYLKRGGFPHSDIAVSLLFCQLLRAFRRLTRPSSPIIAKASTWCTYSLDSIIWRTFDFARIGVDDQPYLDSQTIKLTALLWVVCAFCVSQTTWYNHHPNTVVWFFLTWFYFRLSEISLQTYFKPNQTKIVFVCWFRLSNLLKSDAIN